ncbi:hypothetical protein ACVU7I_15220, partial [Patulibacter sp. S7RM1-6]
MSSGLLPRLLTVAVLLAGTGGLAACGGDELAGDVQPRTVPALQPPSGDGEGAGDRADQITDLPSSGTTTTGPTPSAGDDASDGTTSDGSDGAATSAGSGDATDGAA